MQFMPSPTCEIAPEASTLSPRTAHATRECRRVRVCALVPHRSKPVNHAALAWSPPLSSQHSWSTTRGAPPPCRPRPTPPPPRPQSAGRRVGCWSCRLGRGSAGCARGARLVNQQSLLTNSAEGPQGVHARHGWWIVINHNVRWVEDPHPDQPRSAEISRDQPRLAHRGGRARRRGSGARRPPSSRLCRREPAAHEGRRQTDWSPEDMIDEVLLCSGGFREGSKEERAHISTLKHREPHE